MKRTGCRAAAADDDNAQGTFAHTGAAERALLEPRSHKPEGHGFKSCPAVLASLPSLIESQEGRTMDAGVEDRIVVESERAAQSGRAGVIEEVLAQDPPRFRVRWDDGRTSIFAPSAGVASIERRKRGRVKA